MNVYFNTIVSKVIMVKPEEQKLVLWSFIYFFCLLSGYFILRPLRDEMGIVNGAHNMQWLFTGTFIAMLLIVPIFGFVTRTYSLKRVLLVSYAFFIINLLLFYVLFVVNGKSNILAATFFIWLSVFNLFVVSLFWSFMADVFSSKSSKRTFGIIAAGGSVGALTGPIIAQSIAVNLPIENLILIAVFFLVITLFAILKISSIKKVENPIKSLMTFNPELVLQRDFWKVLKEAFKSKYIVGIVLFIMLYTSVSTILYFQQAYVIEDTITQGKERIVYFSRVDLIINALTIFGQVLITNRLIKKYSLAIALSSIPLLLALGFLIVSYNTSLLFIAVLIIIHRTGNFSILRPSREVLYTVCTKEEKYRVKNFIDTVVYRGGDALTGWIFTLIISLGFGLSVIALLAVPLVLIWSFTGYKLGKKQLEKEQGLTSIKYNYDK